jgi:two-component system, OmpR family, sensor histidine kinase KdpD
MRNKRLSPDELIEKIKEEEHKSKQGKLKIYLGAAPGVGKTYTMLEDALTKRSQGIDVMIGIVESHGRKEIESFLEKFEILPKQTVEYRGKNFLEFDLEAALERKPALILIDEMAHTNVPGLRHIKRWQDIKEVLDRGIDVYTTLNVQHLESINNVVSKILNVQIKETVPDFMLDKADTIEIIDLPPEELLKRLQEGKVYFPEQAELAKENFFRKGNLIALRELALRVTAERVGKQAFLYRQDLGIKQIWPIKDKLLVCVSPRADSAKIIREASRMAKNLNATWIAVYVERPGLTSSNLERNNAIQNLRLAEQLGAETKILIGDDLVTEIMNFARSQNITLIVIGKKTRPRWKDLLFKRLADEIVRHSGEIDIYIITIGLEHAERLRTTQVKKKVAWESYFIAIAAVTLATVVNFLISPYLHSSNLIMVYFLAVIFVARLGETGPSILTSIFSVLAFDFFFVPPIYSFATTDLEYVYTLIVMLVVAQTISYLSILSRRQSEAAKFTAQQISAQDTLSKRLANMRGTDKLLTAGVSYLGDLFNSEIIALLTEGNKLVVHAKYKTDHELNIKEQGVTQWVYDMGQMAGLGTNTLSFFDALYLPILSTKGSIGVLKIRPAEKNLQFTPEQMSLLEACANQIGLAIEVDQLHEQKMQSKLENKADYVRSNLLKSISHDFRTPLVSLMANASMIMNLGDELDSQEIIKVSKKIYLESEEINRLMNNLLQITYLESKDVRLQKQLASLNNLIKLVIDTSTKKLGNRPIKLDLAENLPNILFEKSLMEAVIINLLDNALKFSPVKTEIAIATTMENKKIIFTIKDKGPGIVPDEANKLFKKYYRGRALTAETGLGLGLAICKKIIEAHGGKMWAKNRKQGGAAFYFSLPV